VEGFAYAEAALDLDGQRRLGGVTLLIEDAPLQTGGEVIDATSRRRREGEFEQRLAIGGVCGPTVGLVHAVFAPLEVVEAAVVGPV
jgi:hypothetical protein